MNIKEFKVGSRSFIVYCDPMNNGRLRCAFSDKTGSKPERIIAQLKTFGVDARVEAKDNACGNCNTFCLWNDCFSVPFHDLEKVICELARSGEALYKKPCVNTQISVVIHSVEHHLEWAYQKRELWYFTFKGISNDALSRFENQNSFSMATPLTHEGQVMAVRVQLTPPTKLEPAIEKLVSICS